VPERQQQHIRVTEEQAKQLRRVAKSQGLTIQAFALRAIMAAVAEVEEELRADKERKRRVERDEEAATLSLSNEPQGLGIRARREKREYAPMKTDRRKQVSKKSRHRRFGQVLPREESTPGKPNPCATQGDLRGEA